MLYKGVKLYRVSPWDHYHLPHVSPRSYKAANANEAQRRNTLDQKSQ